MNNFNDSLPMMLYRALDVVMPPFREIFLRYGITEQQWRVLRCLWDDDGANLQTLSELTLIPGPSLVGVIDRLEKAGYVRRKRSNTDRRVVNIFVTAAGQKLQRKVQPHVNDAYANLERSVDAETWRTLRRTLDEITQKMAQTAGNNTEEIK